MSSWKTPQKPQSVAKGQRGEDELLTLGFCLVPSHLLPALKGDSVQGRLQLLAFTI